MDEQKKEIYLESYVQGYIKKNTQRENYKE